MLASIIHCKKQQHSNASLLTFFSNHNKGSTQQVHTRPDAGSVRAPLNAWAHKFMQEVEGQHTTNPTKQQFKHDSTRATYTAVRPKPMQGCRQP